MGLFDGMKKKLNIGGVKIALKDVPVNIGFNAPNVEGIAEFTSKSEQKVKSLTVRLYMQDFSEPGASNVPSNNRDIASLEINQGFDIKPGESKSIPFKLAISASGFLKDAKGALGKLADNPVVDVLGKMGDAAQILQHNNKAEYYLEVTANVEGVALNPSARTEVHMNAPGEHTITSGQIKIG